MARTHPHAEATYRVVPLTDGTYGVEVTIPDSYPFQLEPAFQEAPESGVDARLVPGQQPEARSYALMRFDRPSGALENQGMGGVERGGIGDAARLLGDTHVEVGLRLAEQSTRL